MCGRRPVQIDRKGKSNAANCGNSARPTGNGTGSGGRMAASPGAHRSGTRTRFSGYMGVQRGKVERCARRSPRSDRGDAVARRGRKARPRLNYLRLDQRASAAFRADSARCSAVIFSARAFPPTSPPFRPSATAAGSFPSSGSNGGASPVASSTTCRASSFGSLGRLRERSGIGRAYHSGRAYTLPHEVRL